MNVEEFLSRNYSESMPKWLENFKPGESVDINEVLKSRTVYYPGAGEDGQPVESCVKSLSANVFIYVDFVYNEKEVEDALNRAPFRGYHVIDTINLRESDILANGYEFVMGDKKELNMPFGGEGEFCVMKIFERDADKTDAHGAKRFAIIFLCADGITAYKSIFGGESARKPFIVVLQDHGFGGNYDKFGAGGLMERIANEINVFPELYMVGNNTHVWQGCSKCECDYVIGGMHNNERYLYEQRSKSENI